MKTERKLETVAWGDRRLKSIECLMLEETNDLYKVVNCWGFDRNDMPVWVDLPFAGLPKTGWKSYLIEQAERAGANALRLGALDNTQIMKQQRPK